MRISRRLAEQHDAEIRAGRAYLAVRALDEFFHFHRRDAFDQHAGRGHVHGQGHVHHALHQGDFRWRLAAAAVGRDGARVFQRIAGGQRLDAVVDEEGGAFADAHARRRSRILTHAHARQHVDEQLVRAFMLFPAIDTAFDEHEALQGAFLEGGSDVFDVAAGRQDGAHHAFAGIPFGAREIGEVGARVQVDRGDALLAHERLRLGDALRMFVLADGDHAARHVRQRCQCLFDGSATYAHACSFVRC
ncbi:hypothetical protein D3C72_1528940 [compost metagenome]